MIKEDTEWVDGIYGSSEELTRLTKMAQNGSEQALNELLKKTEKIVRIKIASLLIKKRTRMQEADIDDLVQIIQIKIHKSLPRFHGNSKLATWIHPIVENSYRDSVRRETTQIRKATILWWDMPTQWESLEDILWFIESNIESTIDRTILINLVHEVINDIESPIHRDLLEQVYIHWLTLNEYKEARNIEHLWTALSRSDKARTLFLWAIFELLGSYLYIQLKREIRWND